MHGTPGHALMAALSALAAFGRPEYYTHDPLDARRRPWEHDPEEGRIRKKSMGEVTRLQESRRERRKAKKKNKRLSKANMARSKKLQKERAKKVRKGY